MPIKMTIEQIGIIATLVLTVFGWGVTAVMQFIILDKQISATKASESRKILFSERLEQLQELKKWFHQGEKFWRLELSTEKNKSPKSEIDEWKLQIGKMKSLARLIDFAYSPNDLIYKIEFTAERTLYRVFGQELPPDEPLLVLVEKYYRIVERVLSSKQELPTVLDSVKELDDIYLRSVYKIDKIITVRLSNTFAKIRRIK